MSDKTRLGWQDWRAIAKSLDAYTMELEQFLQLYPDITREQLAKIAGCEISTVNHWFASGKTQREPTEAHKLRLALAHWLKSEPAMFREIRSIMDDL